MHDTSEIRERRTGDWAERGNGDTRSKAPSNGQAQARKAVPHREQLFRRIFSESPIAIVLYDPEGRMVEVNEACRDMVGLPDTFDTTVWTSLFRDPSVPEGVKGKLRMLEVARYQAKVDYDDLRERGLYKGTRTGVCHIDVLASPLGLGRGGALVGYMSQIQDITGLKRAEEKLRSLSSQLSLAEERERRRLASGLHDQVGQTLALTRFKLDALRSGLDEKDTCRQLDEIEALVDEAIGQTRALTFELSPPMLYELGLEPALEWLAEQYEARYGISCKLEDDGRPKLVGDELRGVLFSSVRELLMNVVKHAQAQTAGISICRDGDNVSVSVKDDGVGFDTSDWKWNGGGFGLFNIRERLIAAGGSIEVGSEPGRGTVVTLVVPLVAGEASKGRQD
jgi:signal transduction histidine kinase